VLIYQKFLVLPSTTIQTHLSSTSASLAPDIQKLLQRAETLVDAERTKLQGIEKTIKILQSASLPSSSSASVPRSISASRSQLEYNDQDKEEQEGDIWNSRLDNVELKGLDMVQIKKIRMLRNKRERLEKERAKLGLIE